jgi:hypothetical protein
MFNARRFASRCFDMGFFGGACVRLPAYATVRGRIGFTFQRMYATNVITTNRTAVVTAEENSPRATWKIVAPIITTINPRGRGD